MRGVADEREPLADEAARDLEAERKGFDPRGEAELAELRREAQFELAQEVLRLEREERAGVGAALVPDDARLASGQRQDGERAGRQEVLLGHAFVVALMRDGRDDAGLVVVPAVGRNRGERAQLRPRAVGRDGEAGAKPAAVGERKLGDALAGTPARDRARQRARRRAERRAPRAPRRRRR